MRTFRPIAYFLLIVLLCLIAAGVYIYPRLPAIAVQQAEDLLAEYGVQSIELEAPVVGAKRLQLDKLGLRGELDGVVFTATLGAVDLHYNWRLLLEGRFGELTLEQVELVIEQLPASSEPSNTALIIDQILPHSLLSQIPLQSIEIRHLEVEYRAPELRPVTAVGTLSLLAGTMTLQMSSVYLDSHIDGRLQTGDDTSPLSLDLQVSHAGSNLAGLAAQLQRKSAEHWQWDLEGNLDWAVLLAWARGPAVEALPIDISSIAALTLQGSSAFEAVLQHPNTLHTSPTADLQPLEQLDARLHLENVLPDLDYPPFLDTLSGELHATLSLEDSRWSMAVETLNLTGGLYSAQLSLTPESRQWLGWQELVPISLSSTKDIKVRSDESGAWSAQLQDIVATLGNTKSQLLITGLQLDAALEATEQGKVNADLTASLATRLRKTQLPQMELVFQHQGTLKQGKLKLQLMDTAESMRLLIDGSGNLNTGRGHYSFKASSLDLPYASSTIAPLLEKFDLLEPDLELLSGSFKLQSIIESQGFSPADWQVKSSFIGRDISGSLDEYRFTGMSLTANWQGVEQWKTLAPVEFEVANLNVGFDISGLRATVSLPRPTAPAQPVVSIDNFTANVFGGRVYLPQPQTWDFSSPENHLTLKAEQWQLAELVALQQDQQIDAQGNLEGELPLTLRDGRIIIEKGYLKARAPGGNIRYTPNEASQALAKSSPELGMAMELLRDFRYEVLSSNVELDEAGNLLLGLSLGGRNPSQYDGRQVNFNIKLEQNLDPLLQSLRLSDTLVEKIEERLQ
jgi:hypothetical protein